MTTATTDGMPADPLAPPDDPKRLRVPKRGALSSIRPDMGRDPMAATGGPGGLSGGLGPQDMGGFDLEDVQSDSSGSSLDPFATPDAYGRCMCACKRASGREAGGREASGREAREGEARGGEARGLGREQSERASIRHQACAWLLRHVWRWWQQVMRDGRDWPLPSE